jgi:hypothetical protein
MRLEDDQGRTFELSIDAYQFPESDEYWDANWLVVCGRVTHPRGAWTFRDPCLTTFELEQLAKWFDGVADGNVDKAIGYFTEPNLHFEYVPAPRPAIKLTFAYESCPPWLERDKRLEGTIVIFPLALNDPREASRSLRTLLVQFPVR